jgi:hypothetical protein
MRILIAVSGCQLYENNGVNQSMRDTWLPGAVALGIDYKFFHGRGCTPGPDIVLLDINDAYDGVTEKLKGKVRWAYEHGYDYVFPCFADTYAVPERLLACGFDKFDYFGDVNKGVSYDATFYCHGGAGYFLSRRAMEVINRNTTSYVNDDCWVGDVLSGTDTTMGNSEDFRQYIGSPRRDNCIVTSHLSDSSHHPGVHPFTYSGDYMYAEHKAWLESTGDVPFVPTYSAVVGPRQIPQIQRGSDSIRPAPPPPAPVSVPKHSPLRPSRPLRSM